MHPTLGLSIGTTNFVAVSAGQPPVIRRALLALPPQGPPQLGSPAERAEGTETGLLVDGFVDCVGDQVPLVAADGSTYQPELLLADAIDAMVDAAGADVSQLAIAVPAHWPPAAWQALQEALQSRASPSALGAPPCLVSDAVAALSALHANHGVASGGVVALLDFGGGGTNISLADAASGFQPIGETMRYRQFSGNLIDQAILGYLVGGTDQGGDADPSGTATVGDLTQLTDECRQAKERLSEQTATELIAALPGYQARLALTRAEFDDLIRRPLDGVIVALEQLLQCNRIDWHDLAAIATVGGGARIPLITERLSAGHQVPMVTSQLPALAMAVGAALCGARGAQEAAAAEEAPATAMAAAVTPAATAARATARNGGAGQPDPASHELAWSEEEDCGEPVPFTGEPYSVPAQSSTRSGSEKGRRRHRVPQLAFGIGALAAMIGVGGVTYTLTSASHDEGPAKPADSPTAQVAPPSPKQPPPQAAAPPSAPPAPASPAAPPPPPATTTVPPTTTTTPPPTTTTTTTTPTTTTTTTTATTTTTTTPPPTTTTAPTAAPMTTEYLTLPLVPVPIPIQVPAG